MASGFVTWVATTVDMVNDGEILTPEHCRAARALLGWSQDDLAEKAGFSRGTVKNVEAGQTISPLAARALRDAFEGARILFLRNGTCLDGVTLLRGVALRDDG